MNLPNNHGITAQPVAGGIRLSITIPMAIVAAIPLNVDAVVIPTARKLTLNSGVGTGNDNNRRQYHE